MISAAYAATTPPPLFTPSTPRWLAAELRTQETPLILWRRHLHRMPELGWMEFGTAGFLAAKLLGWGWRLTLGEDALCRAARMGVPPAEDMRRAAARAAAEGLPPEWLSVFADGMTAVRADIHLGPESRDCPLLILRTDMDALAINECRSEDHLPVREAFASLHSGIMHACGHDGHAAILLGLARLLARHRDDFPHPLAVRLLFQPAEEGARGAAAMISAGALDGADILLGMHIGLTARRTGQLVCGADGFLGTTKLDACFTGCPAHAAGAPEEGRNALLAASAAALGLHAISRHGEGQTRVCAGRLAAGENRNAIPAHALLELEVRGATQATHSWLEAEARRVIAGAAGLWNCDVSITTAGSAPAASSDPRLRARLLRCAAAVPFFREPVPAAAFGASEDFSAMMEAVRQAGGQAASVLIGSRLAGGHHTPRFDFDERILLPALSLLAHTCLDIAASPS